LKPQNKNPGDVLAVCLQFYYPTNKNNFVKLPLPIITRPRARRGEFLPDEALIFKTMAARADSALFGAIISNQHHVLRSLCKDRPAITQNLRPPSHPFELPATCSDSRNFLPRLMYQDIHVY